MSLQLGQPSCSSSVLEASLGVSTFVKQILLYLKPLDELLKCHICFEYFNTCMMTKCSHSFCSLCIRKYMTYKTQCPQCFQEAVEPELRSNRQIDEILYAYQKMKMYLQSITENESSFSHLNASAYDAPQSVDNKISMPQSTQIASKSNSSRVSDVLPFDRMTKCNQVPALSNDVLKDDHEKVSCPVCSALVLQDRINIHLDQCLAVRAKSVSAGNRDRRKPLSKVVYRLLSDKDIKKRLKENGLSTSGSRQTLINRHKNFVLLYNSECDKLSPRAVSEIVQQVENEENELKNTESPKLFKSNKKSNPVAIHEENNQYLKKNEHHFNALVSEIRQRQQNTHLHESNISEKSSESASNMPEANSSMLNDLHDGSMDWSFRSYSPDLFADTIKIEDDDDVQICCVSKMHSNFGAGKEEAELKASQLSTSSSDDFDLNTSFLGARQSQGILKRKIKSKVQTQKERHS